MMKPLKKFAKVPFISFLFIVLLWAITYYIITNYGYSFDYTLQQTTRAEITGEPDAINSKVSEIYKNVDIMNTEIGSTIEGKEIQRLYFKNSEENISKIKEIVKTNSELSLNITEVKPGLKIDFSNDMIGMVSLLGFFLLVTNLTLFRKVMDLNYNFLFSLLQICTLLVSIALLLVVFSVLSQYGWHVSEYTFNIIFAYIFTLAAVLAAVSLLFKKSLGDLEHISTLADHFGNFIFSNLKTFVMMLVISVIVIMPFLYFFYFRVEAFVMLFVILLTAIYVRVGYMPVLNWYDQIRNTHNKFSKKKK